MLLFFLAASPSGHTIKDHETVSVYKLLNIRDFYACKTINDYLLSAKYHQITDIFIAESTGYAT